MNPLFHNRQYSRVDWHTYDDGLYFVTLNTLNKVHYFGKIEDGQMQYSDAGEIMVSAIQNLPSHYDDISIEEWVVMPNHVHLIVRIGSGNSFEGIKNPQNRKPLTNGDKRSRLSSMVGLLKSGVKRQTNKNSILFDWNPRFYEHIIRTPESHKNITEYIKNNIKKWSEQK